MGGTVTDQLRFRAGPFEFAPYMRIGEIALDTNVFYDLEGNRRTDVVASGGPGLKVTLPAGRVRFYVDAAADYYWFAKTVEQRHFGGRAGGGFDWIAGGFSLGASRYFVRTYRRPNIEIDQRVLRDEWQDRAYLNFAAGGRLRINPYFTINNSELVEDTSYLGTDLRPALTYKIYTATLEVKYGLTPKTDFLLLGDQQWDRFQSARTRDADSNRLGGGFELKSSTRLSGRAVGGVRLIRPKVGIRGNLTRPWTDANITWFIGIKTQLGGTFHLDSNYSAFASASLELPLYRDQRTTAFFNRRFNRRIDLRLTGELSRLGNNTPVIVGGRDDPQVLKRDDKFYRADADLGFEIFRKLRLGLIANYSERQSNYDDFGIDGLLLGARLSFNP